MQRACLKLPTLVLLELSVIGGAGLSRPFLCCCKSSIGLDCWNCTTWAQDKRPWTAVASSFCLISNQAPVWNLKNHNIIHLEVHNSDQQGSAAGLRPIKHEVGRMPPTELISSTFSTRKPTYWHQQELYTCMVAKSEFLFLEIRNKNLCPASEIEFCGCAGNQPACTCMSKWTNQLPLTLADPQISFSLEMKVVPSRLGRGVGWLFFLI